jgi:hypothetical protein
LLIVRLRTLDKPIIAGHKASLRFRKDYPQASAGGFGLRELAAQGQGGYLPAGIEITDPARNTEPRKL